MDSYKVISLFSGVGGSSCGYKMAGFNVIAAIEFIDYQAKNYKLNNPETKIYEKDIRELKPLKILQELNLKVGELDVLDGSPPCSSFSTAGAREKKWNKLNKYSNKIQRTDDLFLEYIRFLKIIKPKVFVAENVSGLIKGKAKGKFKEFLKKFKDSGYNVKAKLMNSKYYNVPQSRQRVIFIGVRNDLNIIPSYPKPSNKIINCLEAFKDLHNNNIDLKECNIEKYSIYKKAITLKEGEQHKKMFNLIKQNRFLPSYTITQTGSNLGAAAVIHWDNRKFTIKELKRLTTFPDNFILEGTYQQKGEACGRAVPPLMMKAIAKNIKLNILDKIK